MFGVCNMLRELKRFTNVELDRQHTTLNFQYRFCFISVSFSLYLFLNDGAMSFNPQLHTSLPSHLSTELIILDSLVQRSKNQHRSQPFFQRMTEVLRLGRRTARVLLHVVLEEVAAIDHDLLAKVGPQSPGPGEMLNVQFIRAILRASESSSQIVELRHFLPLQLTLVGVYARLFTLALNLASCIHLDVQSVLQGKHDSSALSPCPPTMATRSEQAELGVKLERPNRPDTSNRPVAIPALAQSSDDGRLPCPDSGNDNLLDQTKVKRKRDHGQKLKARKRDTIDNIFGF